ncbi:alpha/beta hydrolase [Nocardia sp. NPDC051981]|uniref:alpha/beta fold hydrolase n=1 Tax=Nocardia sp. NPDC051981 TaxID=3155417 RepID=UPI003418C080
MNSSRIWHTEIGSGTPLVMIHGYTVDHRLLLPLEPLFTSHPGWRRLYLDLPGHGTSPRLSGRTTAASLTGSVLDWIAENVGDQRFAVVGQSFGGQIARAVTARFGDQVLGSALLAPVVRWGEQRTLPGATTITADTDLLAALPDPDRQLFQMVMAAHTRPNWSLFEQYVLPGWRAHDTDAATELESEFLLPNWPETSVPPHRGPHLLITARQDALVGWRDQLDLLDFYPHMTATVIDGAGHNPQVETAETVRQSVHHWLRALES